jgi:hypothetical protein
VRGSGIAFAISIVRGRLVLRFPYIISNIIFQIKKKLPIALAINVAIGGTASGFYFKILFDKSIRAQFSNQVQLIAVEKAARAEKFFQSQRDILLFISTIE